MASPAVLHGTEQHVLHSEAVGADFEITVMPPPAELGVGATPVVYGTDANVALGIYANTIGLLVVGGEIPPVTLVGVGYPIGGDWMQFTAMRNRDFSPSVDQFHLDAITEFTGGITIESGGCAAFLEFLTGELRPWLAANYDVIDDNTYIGSSMGGLFGTYVLLNAPASFQRYILGSPWLTWDEDLCFGWEETYAAAHDDLDAKVFYACGGAEDVLSPALPPPIIPTFAAGNVSANTARMANRLISRNYPNLEITYREYPEQTHFTVSPIINSHGLRDVFRAERLGRP